MVTQASAIEYAPEGDAFVAYRTQGEGPPDLVLVNDWFSHVGALWEPSSPYRAVFDQLAAFGRLIVFDKRGVGMSDPVPLGGLPTLEEWGDGVLAVLDELGVERAHLIGKGSGAPMALLVAATHPERVESVVLVNGWGRLGATDDFPIGIPASDQERMLASTYMSPSAVRAVAGEDLTPEASEWCQQYFRHAASPSTMLAMRRWLFGVDVRSVLSSVSVPVLLLARRRAWIGIAHARYLAEHLPRAQLVELPGAADLLFAGDIDGLVTEIAEFVTGVRPEPRTDRVLATVMFTDLVDSTKHAAEAGDRHWHDLLDAHDRNVRVALQRAGGREVKTTGDGFVATFDGPARAIRCADEIRERVRSIGLEVRIGLHTGEIEIRGDDIAGIGAHIASRIESLAGPGEILVSRTVRDLVTGAGLQFEDRGAYVLKGVPDEWNVYAVLD